MYCHKVTTSEAVMVTDYRAHHQTVLSTPKN